MKGCWFTVLLFCCFVISCANFNHWVSDWDSVNTEKHHRHLIKVWQCICFSEMSLQPLEVYLHSKHFWQVTCRLDSSGCWIYIDIINQNMLLLFLSSLKNKAPSLLNSMLNYCELLAVSSQFWMFYHLSTNWASVGLKCIEKCKVRQIGLTETQYDKKIEIVVLTNFRWWKDPTSVAKKAF